LEHEPPPSTPVVRATVAAVEEVRFLDDVLGYELDARSVFGTQSKQCSSGGQLTGRASRIHRLDA
jgi:hypothetical protein